MFNSNVLMQLEILISEKTKKGQYIKNIPRIYYRDNCTLWNTTKKVYLLRLFNILIRFGENNHLFKKSQYPQSSPYLRVICMDSVAGVFLSVMKVNGKIMLRNLYNRIPHSVLEIKREMNTNDIKYKTVEEEGQYRLLSKATEKSRKNWERQNK